MPQVTTIRAKPIPMTSAVPLMEKMKADRDEKRAKEHENRKQYLLKVAKLPKRMEMHKDSEIKVVKEPESLLVK